MTSDPHGGEQPIDLFPDPSYQDDRLTVVLDAGFHSIMERQQRRSELWARELHVTNRTTGPALVEVVFGGTSRQTMVAPGEEAVVQVDYSFERDALWMPHISLAPVPRLGTATVMFGAACYRFRFNIEVVAGTVKVSII